MTRFVHVLLLGLLLWPSLLLAQGDLTQTFASEDERMTLRYPEGWFALTESDGFTIIATREDLADFSGDVQLPSGEAALALIFSDNPPDSDQDLFVGDTPSEIMSRVLDVLRETNEEVGRFSNPEALVISDNDAARIEGDIGGNDVVIFVMDLGNDLYNLMIGVTAPDELEKFEPKFLAIAASINYAPPPPPPTIDLAGLATITLDNADQLEMLWQSEGHVGTVTSVDISPDSSLVASSGNDTTIGLWNAATGEQQAILTGHTDIVGQVLFTPDGETLVSLSDDQTLRLWDVATGENTLTIEKDEPLFYMAVSPGGRWVAFITYVLDPETFAAESSTVWLLDIQTGQDRIITTLPAAMFVNSVAFDSESDILMFSASNDQDTDARQTITWLWDIERNRETSSEEREGNPVDVFFAPGERPYVVMNDLRDPNDLLVWDVSENYIQYRLSGIGDLTYHVVLNPEGTIMGSASYDGNVSLWNFENGNLLTALRHEGGAYGVVFSDDGKLVATSDDFGLVYLWGITE
jgi:WD40 repeat protein